MDKVENISLRSKHGAMENCKRLIIETRCIEEYEAPRSVLKLMREHNLGGYRCLKLIRKEELVEYIHLVGGDFAEEPVAMQKISLRSKHGDIYTADMLPDSVRKYIDAVGLEYAQDNFLGVYDCHAEYMIEAFKLYDSSMPYDFTDYLDFDAIWKDDLSMGIDVIDGFYFNAKEIREA